MMKKYLVGICAYNEGDKIRRVMQKFCDDTVYDLVIVDDASTDGALQNIPADRPITIIRNEIQKGAGYGVRKIFEYARAKGYDALFFVSGNDKDDPADIVKLKDAIERGYDLVQGSRYLPGGQHGHMPLYRRVATQFMHPLLFSFFSGKKITDSTNGFRAVRLSLLDDTRINLNQDWLNEYELEPYLFFKAIRLGFKVTEVPVTKIYPLKIEGYTKMKPFSGWWSILRPLFYLGFGFKK
ncbi:MAG: glycosyltransferase family 2 protein [Candidatus Omnitrophica bacterium]|nr:glycosyltransferase family 2 protein [Candidatus Omnitrophota bacterium]